ncbi:ATP-binding cassette domain-containing protein [Amycolatopsis sp. NPDC051903]|uniref:ATP-binding cassette domain-containing protein n=1 Tax=Amycolatopsis sp. NPDC051903 TaxID=3363936 RepID=UPI0037B3B6D2
MSEAVLELRGITKSYGPVPVLRGIDLTVRKGQLLGLLGSNGAGKSTMLNIITGAVRAEAGTVALGGVGIPASEYGPAAAAEHGVACVYQELALFPNLSVAENFRLARGGTAPGSRRATGNAATEAIREVFPEYAIPPRTEVAALPVSDRQSVEIGIVASTPDITMLILDEPTSALSREAAARLREYARSRAQQGVAVIYVTHKLDEVLALCDRIVVLRDGQIAWDGESAEVTREGLLTVLGAKEIEERSSGRAVAAGVDADPVLELETAPHDGERIPITVRPGEVVGLAGLEDAGQRRILHAIHDQSRGHRHGAGARLRGSVAYVSGDRQREGVFALWDVSENILVSGLRGLSRWGWLRVGKARAVAAHFSRLLKIVAAGPDAPISALSGGNQQKALIARGLASGASLLLLDDPTRGVDIHTKGDFYEVLGLVREERRGALLYSTEDREFLECDRVYVLAQGRVVRELRDAEITVNEIIRWSYALTGERAEEVKAS